jgi:hypothetical protein
MLPGSSFGPHPASQETMLWDVLLLEDIQCNVCSQYDEAIIVIFLLSSSSFDTPHKKYNMDQQEGITLRCPVKWA